MANLDDYEWFFANSHTTHKSTLLRSEFVFTLPQKPTDDEREEFASWMGGLINSIENERKRKGSGSSEQVGVNALIGGDGATEILVQRELDRDLRLALLSFALVLLYTWFHTTSLCLSLMAMLMIALSFPVSVFFYDLFFGDAKLGAFPYQPVPRASKL